MFKGPVKFITKSAKNIYEVSKKNPTKTMTAIGGASKLVMDFKDKRPVSFRKLQYDRYNTEVLPSLDLSSYIELNSYKQEAQNFIKQIEQEQKNDLFINKPIHSKRSKSWNQVLIHIEDKIKIRNYEELFKAYHSSTYECNYFEVNVINKMKNIENKNELYKYIQQYTDRDLEEIEKDFS